MLLGTMFLPNAAYQVPILRVFDKGTATVLATFLGILLFDSGRLMRYRFHWVDIPMVVWCVCPLASSLSNGLGFYDGLAEIMSQLNLIQSTLFPSAACTSRTVKGQARNLARWLLIGGLIYDAILFVGDEGRPVLPLESLWVLSRMVLGATQARRLATVSIFIHGLWLGGFMAYASILWCLSLAQQGERSASGGCASSGLPLRWSSPHSCANRTRQ